VEFCRKSTAERRFCSILPHSLFKLLSIWCENSTFKAQNQDSNALKWKVANRIVGKVNPVQIPLWRGIYGPLNSCNAKSYLSLFQRIFAWDGRVLFWKVHVCSREKSGPWSIFQNFCWIISNGAHVNFLSTYRYRSFLLKRGKFWKKLFSYFQLSLRFRTFGGVWYTF